MIITKIPLSVDNAINSLLAVFRWGEDDPSYPYPTNLTFSFPYANNPTAVWERDYSLRDEPGNYATFAFQANHQQKTIEALQQWANVANINFRQISETDQDFGDLRFTFIDDAEDEFQAWGWAYLPTRSSTTAIGDVWVEAPAFHNDWVAGDGDFCSLMHEIGHALGLKHPFEGDAILPADQATDQYSVMSYDEHPKSLFGYGVRAGNTITYYSEDIYPSTPMLYDIAAIQHVYGANRLYNAEHTVYTFEPDQPFLMTIWDAAGDDTIDLSNFSKDAVIDLREGAFSDIPIEVAISPPDWVKEEAGLTYDGTDNLAIAFGTVIENAIGGSGDDVLIGNAENNYFEGGSGNDIIYGGAGIDTARFPGRLADHEIVKHDGHYMINGNTLEGVERFIFDDQGLAIDLDSYAGEVAKTLGAVVGPSGVERKDFVSAGLELMDAGMSYESLVELAVQAAGATTSREVVDLLWFNLTGTETPEAEALMLTDLLDNSMTIGLMGVVAANTEMNLNNIDFDSLVLSGLSYDTYQAC